MSIITKKRIEIPKKPKKSKRDLQNNQKTPGNNQKKQKNKNIQTHEGKGGGRRPIVVQYFDFC